MAHPKQVVTFETAKNRKQASPAGKLYSSRGPKFACKFRLPQKYKARVAGDLEEYGITMAQYFELIAIDFLESGRGVVFHKQPNVSHK